MTDNQKPEPLSEITELDLQNAGSQQTVDQLTRVFDEIDRTGQWSGRFGSEAMSALADRYQHRVGCHFESITGRSCEWCAGEEQRRAAQGEPPVESRYDCESCLVKNALVDIVDGDAVCRRCGNPARLRVIVRDRHQPPAPGQAALVREWRAQARYSNPDTALAYERCAEQLDALEAAPAQPTRAEVIRLRKRSFIRRDSDSWHVGWNEAIDAVLALYPEPQAPQEVKP